MGEPFGSGDGRERIDGARRKCCDQYRARSRAQDFGDHGCDHHESSDATPPATSALRNAASCAPERPMQ